MPLTEPMTLATDYLLAAVGIVLARKLAPEGEAATGALAWWRLALVAMAVAAFAGGTFHGFTRLLPAMVLTALWKLTMVAIGVAGTALARASVEPVLSERGRRVAAAALWMELALYAVWVLFVDDGFGSAVVQYGAAMLLAAAIHTALALRGRPAAWWIVGGVAVSLAAAAIQQSGLSLHRHFNQNDLYHVVQVAGLFLFFRGARRLHLTAPGASVQ